MILQGNPNMARLTKTFLVLSMGLGLSIVAFQQFAAQ